MSLVYLAGGINGLSDSDAIDWRTIVKNTLSRELGVIDPMSRDYRGVEDANVEQIVKGDLADIDKCHAILANCARPSWGTAMELHYAAMFRMIRHTPLHSSGHRLIVAVVPAGTAVSPWLRFHTDEVVTSLAHACTVVEGWLLK